MNFKIIGSGVSTGVSSVSRALRVSNTFQEQFKRFQDMSTVLRDSRACFKRDSVCTTETTGNNYRINLYQHVMKLWLLCFHVAKCLLDATQ